MPLSPKAAERVAREAAREAFAESARSINQDWGTHYDGRQVHRWGRRLGEQMLALQQAELEACERGQRPAGPANDPELLVVQVDGGRVQGRERNSETGSRWREDKVATITSYRPGDGDERKPQPLMTTHVATMGDAHEFGRLVRLEAERRGIRQAHQVLFMGDAGNWIDPLHQRHFPRHPRTVDYYHATEHLSDVAKAVHRHDPAAREALTQTLKDHLWHGRLQDLIDQLFELSQAAGPPQEQDPADHPRRVLANNLGYFERHRNQMNYPEYRRRGWPIGTGNVEAGVKQFNKRVKGTEQFWHEQGVEPILVLRSFWLSQDDRWNHYWLWGQYRARAA